MKGLTRVDHEGKQMFGWLARAYGGGKTFSKFFSDKKYGGKEGSRETAVEFLENLTAEVREKYANYRRGDAQPRYRRRPGSSNQSGIPGIHRCETRSRGRSVQYWVATWNENGKPRDKTFYFSDRKNGRSEDDAKRLAIEWRARKILELSGKNEKLPRPAEKKQALTGWVVGIEIEDWSTDLSVGELPGGRKVKRREPFTQKRIDELRNFLGIAGAVFDWSTIDFEFGRGVFEGDLRSRCFWNTTGIRTDVIVDNNKQLLVQQGIEPDRYYCETKPESDCVPV